ncbi:SOS response-associated peptidase [Halomonas organivorans]|uniref:SOS response-associated peptidase n=1 Tax=Halomonas organivorans TaxID=257772 RepID=UPI001608057F|nr:SOS response-associated peptidase [Halomonas organivorans]
MCGRFALYDIPRVRRSLRIILGEDFEPLPTSPRYNVCPGTWITAAWHSGEGAPLALGQLWWGYRPHWATGKAPEPINAKSEGVATSRYFRSAFARHRCLVPADGWYEWLALLDGKQPHYITRADREPLWLAGIWTERPDGNPGCAILTEPARGAAAEIHDRMPLALDDDSLAPWLDPHMTDREALRGAVHHLDDELLTHWPVSRRVNRPANDDASLIEPADDEMG